jgi:hypothetical protein
MTPTRPVRWPRPTASTIAVITAATIAAGTRSCTGAPPAGSPAAKSVVRVWEIMVTVGRLLAVAYPG